MDMIRVPLVADQESVIPQYSRYGDAGADLRATHDVTIPVFGRELVKTGVKLELPEGYMGMVTPRSGLALKQGITVLNAPGIIDSGYRGEVGVILYNTSAHQVTVHAGDRIAQLVIAPFVIGAFEPMMVLGESERGAGGFGSTGVQ